MYATSKSSCENQPGQDSNPWPLRCRCSSLPTKLSNIKYWSHVGFPGKISTISQLSCQLKCRPFYLRANGASLISRVVSSIIRAFSKDVRVCNFSFFTWASFIILANLVSARSVREWTPRVKPPMQESKHSPFPPPPSPSPVHLELWATSSGPAILYWLLRHYLKKGNFYCGMFYAMLSCGLKR